MLRVYYNTEPPVNGPVIYLAGPTYVPEGEAHWHDEVLTYLKQHGFEGAVCLPTPPPGSPWLDEDATAQMEWQHRNLARATVICFWVPRAGLVTYAEFGEWYLSGKVVLGIPPNTEKTDYLQFCARRANVLQANTLEHTVELVLDMCWR